MIDLAENLQRSAKKLLFNPSAKAVQDYVHDSVELIGKLINEFAALKAEKELAESKLSDMFSIWNDVDEFARPKTALGCKVSDKVLELLKSGEKAESKLAEMEAQEPCAYYYPDTKTAFYMRRGDDIPREAKPLYSLPVQQSPAVAVQQKMIDSLKEVMCSDRSCDKKCEHSSCCMPEVRELYQLLSTHTCKT